MILEKLNSPKLKIKTKRKKFYTCAFFLNTRQQFCLIDILKFRTFQKSRVKLQNLCNEVILKIFHTPK